VTVSSGFLDRGWWLIPVLKVMAGRGGWSGGNRLIAVLDPLFRYERFSIAEPGAPEGAGEARTEVEVLGGLLGWERSDGRTAVRILWIRL